MMLGDRIRHQAERKYFLPYVFSLFVAYIIFIRNNDSLPGTVGTLDFFPRTVATVQITSVTFLCVCPVLDTFSTLRERMFVLCVYLLVL